jgi:dolichol-phosphate mannosyltransferase
MSATVPYRKALYANCGLKTAVLSYKPSGVVPSVRQWDRYRRDTAFSSLILFTNIAAKLSLFMTAVMMLITFAGIVRTIMVYATGQPVEGYTTTMLVMTGGFFVVFALLAIIIQYLTVLIDLNFKKQRYLVKSVEKITK